MNARVVFKFQIPANQFPTAMTMPVGARIISVGSQQPATVCLWAEVDQDHRGWEERRFVTVPTGVEFNSANSTPLGTANVEGLPPARAEYVLHVYEILPEGDQ